MRNLVLASKSPRRKELLGLCGVSFTIDPSASEETIRMDLPLGKAIELVAYEKAKEVFQRHPDELILGSDTIVVVNGQILGKPKDKEDARRMIRLLSGNTHEVITGVAFLSKEDVTMFHEVAEVTFGKMTEEEIEAYISTEEPYDKAGAYALQGGAAIYIENIKGDYYTIVGLPVHRVYEYLKTQK